VKTLSEDGEDLISGKKRNIADVRGDHIQENRTITQDER
jgi:hypothetical protein